MTVATRACCGVALMMAVLAAAPATGAQEHRGDPWRFDHGRGWRFEQRPGLWSPYYV